MRCRFLRAFASATRLFPLAAMWDGINTHARQSNAVMKLISSWLDYCIGLLADCPTKTNHLWQAVWSTPAHASPRKPLSHHYFACLLSISDDKDRQPHHSYMQKIALMYTCTRRKPQRKKCVTCLWSWTKASALFLLSKTQTASCLAIIRALCNFRYSCANFRLSFSAFCRLTWNRCAQDVLRQLL